MYAWLHRARTERTLTSAMNARGGFGVHRRWKLGMCCYDCILRMINWQLEIMSPCFIYVDYVAVFACCFEYLTIIFRSLQH
jgi:hypothetical protein